MKKLLTTFQLLVASSICGAQQPSVVTLVKGGDPHRPIPPDGLLLGLAPDYSQWEISFMYADEQKKSQSASTKQPTIDEISRPHKIIATKTDKIMHIVTLDARNQKQDLWADGKAQYVKTNSGNDWTKTITPQRGNGEGKVSQPVEFAGMDLVKAINYSGTILNGSASYLVFTPGGYDALKLDRPEDLGRKIATLDTFVYVDAASRMPVASKTPTVVLTYHFDSPPTALQVLPVDLTSQIKAGADHQAALEAPMLPP